MRRLPGLLILIFVLTTSLAHAGAEDDWGRLVALDAGPAPVDVSNEEAVRTATLKHLEKQEAAYRGFAAKYRKDPRALDAEFRLVNLLGVRSDLEKDPKSLAAANELLDNIAKRLTLTPSQRATVGFLRVSLLVRRTDPESSASVETLLKATRNFQKQFPADRRVARLLVKCADYHAADGERSRALLEEARTLAKDEMTMREISDDLKQLDTLGKTVSLRFTSFNGEEIDVARYKGKPVVICFFAAWSPPSMQQLRDVQKALAVIGAAKVQPIGVSLDREKADLDTTISSSGISWPIAFDGQGWESPLVRSLAINTLPTVWILDRDGRLRELNARKNLDAVLQRYLLN